MESAGQVKDGQATLLNNRVLGGIKITELHGRRNFAKQIAGRRES